LKQLVETGPTRRRMGSYAALRRPEACSRTAFSVVDLSEVSLGRALKKLGFSHISARPRHPVQDPETIAAFKKTFLRRSRRIVTKLAPENAD